METASRNDFEHAFELVLGHEGGLSMVRDDPGNWTGGRVGVGELRGTKWGISAASYPHLDIAALPLTIARDIYFSDFWERIGAHAMPPRLAFVAFDAAINNGPARAARWLQAIVGADPDGIVGPRTLDALGRRLRQDGDGDSIAQELHAQRIHFMAGLATWRTFGLGWSRRLAAVPFEAALTWPAGPFGARIPKGEGDAKTA